MSSVSAAVRSEAMLVWMSMFNPLAETCPDVGPGGQQHVWVLGVLCVKQALGDSVCYLSTSSSDTTVQE